MQTTNELTIKTSQRRPWNKGKFIGPKPPLQPRHVWPIRTRLQLDGRIREVDPESRTAVLGGIRAL